jgi:superfamily II DNA or RNA helicase
VPRWPTPPAIVAEALVGVPDPLLTALHVGPPASGAAVASSITRSLAPPADDDRAPHWLLPEQEPSFRRALAAVRRYRGAVLADPVGSGKTFVALAVAAILGRATTACLVPATLLGQWERAAARVGVRVRLCSHEQVSRGKLPEGTRGLVIIDESHHFRNPHTRRYGHLAPWLVGRPALLVTATPIVNRLVDLGHQLLLTVRDDVLAADGIVSLRMLLEAGCPAPALGRLVIESEIATHRRPARIHHISRPIPDESATVEHLAELLARLRLSSCGPIAALIRGVMLRAAGSSPAALAGALRRYRRLLLHARDAFRAGRVMDRTELRQFTADSGDQLIWWELLPAPESNSEIELTDLAPVEDLIRAAVASEEEDQKLERLRNLLADGVPSLVFTTSRHTVRYLRDRLGDSRLAWCTGERAGIGTATLDRRRVLAWFREPVTSNLAPRHLIVTDVAAEGLDLQRAARVIHYDLPWTPMRLEQREGRSVRYGSQNSRVDVVRFAAPPPLERLLQLEMRLERKAGLPAAAGIGPDGRHLWRWRTQLAEQFGRSVACAGVAAADFPRPGLLAGFALSPTGRPDRLSAAVLWLEPDGSWTEAPETVAARLEVAAAQQKTITVDQDRLKEWLSLLAVPIRERLALARSRRWVTPDPPTVARRLAARLQRLVGEAARRHEAARLAQLEQGLGFLAGGHSAGEVILIEQLAGATKEELTAGIARLPRPERRWDGLEVRLTGLVVFGPASFSACPDSRPPSSTSTGP